MTWPGKRSLAKVGIKPRSAALAARALPVGQRGSVCNRHSQYYGVATLQEQAEQMHKKSAVTMLWTKLPHKKKIITKVMGAYCHCPLEQRSRSFKLYHAVESTGNYEHSKFKKYISSLTSECMPTLHWRNKKPPPTQYKRVSLEHVV